MSEKMIIAAQFWANQIEGGMDLVESDRSTLARLLRDLSGTIEKGMTPADLKAHDEEVIRVHAAAVMSTLRETMTEALVEAEMRGYKRQIDERLAALLVGKALDAAGPIQFGGVQTPGPVG